MLAKMQKREKPVLRVGELGIDNGRASETVVQREVRLVSRRIRDRARRADESEERRKVRL